MKKTAFSVSVAVITFLCMLAFSLFAVDFSSVFYVLISGTLGATVYAFGYVKNKNNAPKGEVEK